MIVNDDNYFRVLWQHNHRVTRALGGEAPKRNEGLRRLERLLLRTGLAPQGTKVVDLGYLVLLGAHDEDAYEGRIESFRQFCEVTGADLSGVPAGRFVDGRWETVEDQRCYLLGRARRLEGYRREFAEAGFAVEHEETFGKPGKVVYVLRKASPQRSSNR